MYSGFSEIIWRNSPQYLQAYEEGYKQAKREISEMLERMQALYTTSTTSVFTEPKGGVRCGKE